jgi:Ni/Co efflux regulator RcnB
MKAIYIGLSVLALATSQMALAQPGERHGAGQNYRGQQQQAQMRHNGWGRERGNDHRWRRGQQMGYNDWNHAERVDYRQHHLRKPPRGYEWRRQNDQFVLGAIATGVIASIILNSGR